MTRRDPHTARERAGKADSADRAAREQADRMWHREQRELRRKRLRYWSSERAGAVYKPERAEARVYMRERARAEGQAQAR